MSKFIGQVYDGRWEVISFEKTTKSGGFFTLKNIFNNKEIRVCSSTMTKIGNGKGSVSNVIRQRIFLEGKNDDRTFIFNNWSK